ncbi:hypothetical protein RIF29_03401 [Crotalaria pallida]|uniref:t-SNARE coiled-coil homology domain-containing protein n=1 Tax=Crotalaria pallida TaxID=3830 RepID=A0AAN9IZW9_CROPI
MVAPSVFDEEEFFSADSRFNRWSRYKDRDYCEIRWINSRWFIQEQFQFVGLLQNQELEDIQADIGNLQLGHDQNMETEDGGSNENFLSIHSNRHVDDCFLGYVNSQFDQMNNRLDGMNVHLARIDSRIDQIEQRIADNHQSIMQYLSDAFASLRFPSSG